jgi:hypothetical protein
MTTITAPVTVSGRSRAVAVADVAAKVLLFALLLSAIVWPDLSGLKGKATTARLIVYPLGAMALPIIWYLARRRQPFPWLADLLMTLPWLVDLAGNRLDLFDAVPWWDDLMHFALWGLLTAGVLVAFTARTMSRGLTTMVALGFGTTAAVIWEAGEYVAFIRHSPELQTAYTDTLGDLVLGTLGALLAGLVVGQIRARRAGLTVKIR